MQNLNQSINNAVTMKGIDWCVIHKDEGKITQPPVIFKSYERALKQMKKLGGNDGWNTGWFVTSTFAIATRAKWA
jgi:hypothetical protein